MKRPEGKFAFTMRGVFFGLVMAFALALLIGFLFAMLSRRPPDRRSEAAATVRNIVMALRCYQNDHGKFPPLPTLPKGGVGFIFVGDPAAGAQISNRELFNVLRAIPIGANANHLLNKRQQRYFDGPKAKDPKHPRSGFADGPEFAEADQGCLFDTWGHQYCIVFTTDGAGTLDLSAVYSDLAGPEHLIRSPVAAFSLGQDGIPGGKGYEGKFRKPASNDAPDDIVSWQ
jgi:hypothetical protein